MLLVALALVSCKKPATYGDLCVNIGYSINGNPLITDSLCYHNEAGNEFMITEIQWFISNMELQNELGAWNALEPKIFYIDTNIPESQALRMNQFPLGNTRPRVSFSAWTRQTTEPASSQTRPNRRCFGPICLAEATIT